MRRVIYREADLAEVLAPRSPIDAQRVTPSRAELGYQPPPLSRAQWQAMERTSAMLHIEALVRLLASDG